MMYTCSILFLGVVRDGPLLETCRGRLREKALFRTRRSVRKKFLPVVVPSRIIPKNKTLRTQSSNQGYVLIIVLVFLLIFSFMGLHSLIYTAEMIKMTHDQFIKDNDRRMAKQILSQIEARLMNLSSSCNIRMMPAFMFANKPLSWWQQYGCHDSFQKMNYYYVVESLEKDSCGIIKKKPYNNDLIAMYERITLYFRPNQSIVGKNIFQSTIVKAAYGNNAACSHLHIVHLGRQMLREL